jgi:hypothetical protein
MRYLTQVRMRANCDRGIWLVAGGSGLTGAWTTSRRAGLAGKIIPRTRGLRADWWSPGVEDSGANGAPTGGFDLNSASASWCALVIRSRLSPPG